MSAQPAPDLPPGLYEHLFTGRLERAVGNVDPSLVRRGDLDPADAEAVLTRHVAALVQRLLRSARGDLSEQMRLANTVSAAIQHLRPTAFDGADEQVVTAEILLALLAPPMTHAPAPPREPQRPEVPLAASALLVNGRGQPRVGWEIRAELDSADRVDLLCAFITWQGYRLIDGPLRAARERGVPVRVITTTYLGATHRRALDALVDIGAEVKVSYETQLTRLHAKAWLFRRASGLTTAYVGSSNLSRTAQVDGLEWNVRLTAAEQPHLLDTFAATFDDYWSDAAFEPYQPARDAARFDLAIAAERGGPALLPMAITALDVRPYPYQREILDELDAERRLHGRQRNLVVAATGTGKTVMAALDYERLRAAGDVNSLLFVAHREELLAQGLTTFRHVLRDGTFGEDLVAGRRPEEWRHVFASVQSLARLELNDLDPGRFDMVIVDEFHHAMAPTYTRLLDHLRPRVLLGLTATPERADGQDVTAWFGGRIASELRLWEALERGLLCPFQYFGAHDGVDVGDVPWRRGAGYDLTALSNVYTGHHARARLVAQVVADKVTDPGRMRALGFCVSIDHAEFMAERFRFHGVPALAVSTRSSPEERRAALVALRDRRVNVLFAVDLFNEGLDVPEIDTVLFLRPTESPTVFLQQLGRGLRLAPDKPCLTVLDFIGNQHARFRFDLRYRALTGTSRRRLERELKEGFPYLPAGCHLEFDRVAADIVLGNVRRALRLPWRDLVVELRSIGDVGLAEFLDETGIELEDLYRRRNSGWAGLRREAGFEQRPTGPQEEQLAAAIGRLLHVDDVERLRHYHFRITARSTAVAAEHNTCRESALRDQRLDAMLHFALRGRDVPPSRSGEQASILAANPVRRDELADVLDLLAARARRVTRPLRPGSGVPLHVHARYTLAEALAAFGHANPAVMRQGVWYAEAERADLFFVTLRKSEMHYSPTTRYNDYAISPTLFHWESQSTTTAASPTGRRYVNHERDGTSVHLFVRESKDGPLGAAAYLYAGTAHYVSHERERPMRIVWRLDEELPGELFSVARVAAG